MTYWAAATAATANTREKTSCLKAVMPRTVAREAVQIARMTRAPTKAGLALVALGLFGQLPPLASKLGVRAHDARIMKRHSAIADLAPRVTSSMRPAPRCLLKFDFMSKQF